MNEKMKYTIELIEMDFKMMKLLLSELNGWFEEGFKNAPKDQHEYELYLWENVKKMKPIIEEDTNYLQSLRGENN